MLSELPPRKKTKPRGLGKETQKTLQEAIDNVGFWVEHKGKGQKERTLHYHSQKFRSIEDDNFTFDAHVRNKTLYVRATKKEENVSTD